MGIYKHKTSVDIYRCRNTISDEVVVNIHSLIVEDTHNSIPLSQFSKDLVIWQDFKARLAI